MTLCALLSVCLGSLVFFFFVFFVFRSPRLNDLICCCRFWFAGAFVCLCLSVSVCVCLMRSSAPLLFFFSFIPFFSLWKRAPVISARSSRHCERRDLCGALVWRPGIDATAAAAQFTVSMPACLPFCLSSVDLIGGKISCAVMSARFCV